jgi:hypothetical protein
MPVYSFPQFTNFPLTFNKFLNCFKLCFTTNQYTSRNLYIESTSCPQKVFLGTGNRMLSIASLEKENINVTFNINENSCLYMRDINEYGDTSNTYNTQPLSNTQNVESKNPHETQWYHYHLWHNDVLLPFYLAHKTHIYLYTISCEPIHCVLIDHGPFLLENNPENSYPFVPLKDDKLNRIVFSDGKCMLEFQDYLLGNNILVLNDSVKSYGFIDNYM